MAGNAVFGRRDVLDVMNLDKLINSQITLCEVKRRLEEEGRRPKPVRVEGVVYGPCLLLSRECGTGGEDIARSVGERLGWHVFDRELVEEIARQSHVREQLIESVDEHVRTVWQQSLALLRSRQEFGPESFLHYLHEVVLALGHHGDVVIVGRGAQFLLPSKCALRVRVVAPLGVRIRRVMQVRHITEDAAAQFIRDCDEHRASFIRRAFHEDTHSPLNYDLLLNVTELSLEAAAEVVIPAMRAKLGVLHDARPIPCAH